LPTVSVTLSSEVCPEIREYERLSTACANAYVQPIMAGYLGRLENMARETGLTCPIYLMTSGGGLTSIDLARRFPIRLVESGPAGGAILAARVAQECKLDRVLSFDMGGTTAKICLIDDFEPQHARTFEVARQYRFQKGSGLPLRIPVIEMVEIGAGGGSIARVDNLQRITVGPDSAASEPGPACYGRGGTNATVTDADTVLGRIDPGRFAGGTISLNPEMSKQAICHAVAKPLEVDVATAAFGICEVVEENMANAARVHAVERGKELGDRTLVAFGGAAPLHAARLAEKIGIGRVVVPSGAGVGSAVGFLDAPVAFELVRSRYMRLSEFDPTAVAAMFSEMRSQAEAIVRPGAMNAPLSETRTADMRYRGQGHEITVFLPVRPCSGDDKTEYQHLFESAYEKQFGRTIPGLDIEIISWSTRLSAFDTAAGDSREARTNGPMALTQVSADLNAGVRRVYDPRTGEFAEIPLYWRDDLTPGDMILGPAIIAEAETSTFVTASFSAHINLFGYIVLDRIGGHGRPA
jgi:N-methylhydantoinase A